MVTAVNRSMSGDIFRSDGCVRESADGDDSYDKVMSTYIGK